MFVEKENFKRVQQLAEEGLKASFELGYVKEKFTKLERMYDSSREELYKLKSLEKDAETFQGKYDYTISLLRSENEKLKLQIQEKDALLNKYKINNSVIVESEVNQKVNTILTEVIKNQDSLLKAFTRTKE